MIHVSKDIKQKVKNQYAKFFASLSNVSEQKLMEDVLSVQKPLIFEKIIHKYIDIRGLKVLEIGAGFGINLVVWTKKFKIEGYGLEPSGEGFESSYKIARQVFEENEMDATHIIDGVGEKIPFPEHSFDFIFSISVLEHVQNPEKVFEEGLRVLKPGGVMILSYPNFHSFYEGHYAVLHPPIFSQKLFEGYIKFVCRRDSSFSKTLRTELNVFWTRRTLKKLKSRFDFEILTLGEELFLERMVTLKFETWAGIGIIKKILKILAKLKLNVLAAKVMLATQTWGPLMVVVKKRS